MYFQASLLWANTCTMSRSAADDYVNPFLRFTGVHGEAQLSAVGRSIAQLLASVMSQHDSLAERQLRHVLRWARAGACGATFKEKLVAPHHQITKASFAKAGMEKAEAMATGLLSNPLRDCPDGFSDSEEEAGDMDDDFGFDHEDFDRGVEPADGEALVSMMEHQMFSESVERCMEHKDTLLDRSEDHGAQLFPQKLGYGRPVNSRYVVLFMYDADFLFYFLSVDAEVFKIQYFITDGLPLGYFLHKNVIGALLADAHRKGQEEGQVVLMTLRDRMLSWICNVLRSPLSMDILQKVEYPGQTSAPPPQNEAHVNTAVIAFCLCQCCPTDTALAQYLNKVLVESWSIPPSIRKYIRRKEQYGILCHERWDADG